MGCSAAILPPLMQTYIIKKKEWKRTDVAISVAKHELPHKRIIIHNWSKFFFTRLYTTCKKPEFMVIFPNIFIHLVLSPKSPPQQILNLVTSTRCGPVRRKHRPLLVSLRSNDMQQWDQWKQGSGQVTQHLQNRLQQRCLERDKILYCSVRKMWSENVACICDYKTPTK